MNRGAFIVGCALFLAGCPDSADIDPMQLQQRYKPYDPSDFYADGRSLRPPPPGTIPRNAVVGDPAYTTGMVKGGAVMLMPIKPTPELVERGRMRFDISCAPCHGLLGDGNSIVASKMSLLTPPSLLTSRVRDMADGLVFRAITEGYGLMPSYAAEIPVHERWAAVLYLRALQISQNSPLGIAPREVRERLEEETP